MTFSPKPPTCQGCPAYTWGLGFVPPAGPEDPTLVMIGEGPQEDDAYQGQVFFEKSYAGSQLVRRLHLADLPRSRVLMGNLVQCWLPQFKQGTVAKGLRGPTAVEVRWCWNAHLGPRLGELSTSRKPRHLLTVGPVASRWFKGMKRAEAVEVHYGTTVAHEMPPMKEN